MRSLADGLGALLAAAVDAEAGEDLSALGHPLVAVDVADAPAIRRASADLRTGAPILVGVDRPGQTPEGLADAFDILLTTAHNPPRPWVQADRLDGALAGLRATVARVASGHALMQEAPDAVLNAMRQAIPA